MKYVLFALLTLALVNGRAAHSIAPTATPVKNYGDTTKPVKKPALVATDSTKMAIDSTSVDSAYHSDRVQVKGYYRKNGTYVAPYTRSAPRKRH